MVIELSRTVLIGLCAFLFCEVLTRPGEVFEWWPRLVERVGRMKDREPFKWNWFQILLYKWLYGCAKCMAGAIAFMSVFWWPPASVEHVVWRVAGGIFTAFWLTQRNETSRL